MPELTQTHRFLSFHSSLGEDVLVIERFKGEDALGRLFDYRVLALAADDTFDFDDLVGTSACVAMERASGKGEKLRHFHGIVSQVNHTGYNLHGRGRYEITLVPWLWLLTRTSDCRIFQNLTVPEIIRKVFAGIKGATHRFELSGTYPTREYCVQYRETDFNFVQRLMEHEGIYYFWEHKEGAHTMVLCDNMASHKPSPGFAEIRYRAHGSGIQNDVQIHDWQVRRSVTPGKFTLNSFDFKTPNPSSNTRLLSRSDRSHRHQQGDHEIYDNPGDYIDRADGERVAAIRREELQCQSHMVTCRTNARGLSCGGRFKAMEVPRKDQNKEHLITATTFEASAGNYDSATGTGADTYECTLSGIPASGVFRSARNALPNKVEGPQTAIVCGPAGEEVWVDPYGRVKVQFLWDREGKFDAGSSCWIRVSQAWAGKSFGGMAVPRIGQEVIVDFLEGNPDRPIITGRVYNGASMPHASNAGRDGKPGNVPPPDLSKAPMMTSFKSNSFGGSGGYNEITMNDTGGAEGLFFKAQKDEIHKVGNDREDDVGNDEKRKVGNNRSEEIGVDATEVVGNAKVIDVGNTLLIKAGTSITLQCGASTIHMNQAGFISITGTVITTAAAVNASMVAPLTEIVGAAMLAEAGGLIKIYGGTTHVGASGMTKVSGNTVFSDAKADHVTSGAKVASVASGENIVQGATVKLN